MNSVLDALSLRYPGDPGEDTPLALLYLDLELRRGDLNLQIWEVLVFRW